MSNIVNGPAAIERLDEAPARGRGRVREKTLDRPRVRGKFLFSGDRKLYLRGVTYGPFHPGPEGCLYHDPETVNRDFAAMAANGINAVRVYTVPPPWLLDTARRHGIYVMVGIPWEQHIAFLDESRADAIEEQVRAAVQFCARHPAVLCFAIGNEIPASVVRWHGRRRVERFLRRLYSAAKEEDPTALVTYINFPSTEYLGLDFLDFLSFNVYLESEDRLTAYLARLQQLAGDRPLVMAEVGLDSQRNGEIRQAEVLDWQVRRVFSSGCAGIFVFAWTDEWSRGGFEIEDWDFGLTRRNRRPKLALSAVFVAFKDVPFAEYDDWPFISVVICSYNGERTIRQTITEVLRMDYPNYEVIVVDDGSRDNTAAIASSFADVRLITVENGGLSAARNIGMQAAEGEIIAYIDDDAYPDLHWLYYLAAAFRTSSHVAVGGPNIPPPGDGAIAECVANAPGGPLHVMLTDEIAEHIPGCNFSVRRAALEAAGGFDPFYRVAGDDVDACWRLQEKGTIGFAPSAVVWHHRRNSLRAYWKQQKGYGRAEALLERKWPGKYTAAGHLTWLGRVYGTGVLMPVARRLRVYHGVWGAAPFQRMYESAPGLIQSWAAMPEWYLVLGCLAPATLLGIFWRPLLLAAALLVPALLILFGQAIVSAVRARFPSRPTRRFERFGLIGLTALLFLIQPVARLWGRMTYGLTPWRKKPTARAARPVVYVRKVWSERWKAPEEWLGSFESAASGHTITRRGDDFDSWDIRVIGGLTGSASVLLGVEEHGAGRQLLRWKIQPRPGRSISILAAASLLLAFVAWWSGSAAGAWTTGIIAALFGLWVYRDCSLACGAALAGVQRLSEELR